MSEIEILEVIHEWKMFWMNQTQNNPQDYENYFHRALGVDANMSHHLAKMLHEALAARVVEGWEK